MDSVRNVDIYDKTVLNLILVCKDWRLTILQYENDEKFQNTLWYPLLNQFNFRKKFEWKHLVLIPDKYLKLMINMNNYMEMTEEEYKHYDELIGSEHDEFGMGLCYNTQTNIPLLIAIIQKCPKLFSIYLSGELCEDIFFAIGDRLEELRSINFSYAKNAESGWFDHFIYPDSPISKSLQDIHFERSYWINDEAMFYFSHCPNLLSISCEKPYVTVEGWEDLFGGCTKLVNVDVFHGYIEESMGGAIKALTENNKEIVYLSLNCGGIDDECLDYFMDPGVCPKLKTFYFLEHDCSQEKLDEFKKNRPTVNVSDDEEEEDEDL